jgi:hypothetical protein
MKPDIIECEFEDAKTKLLGHSWKDICEYLTGKGYFVYVSEWHPIARYGTRHDFLGIKKYPCELEDENAWGNLLAFRVDPGESKINDAVQAVIDIKNPVKINDAVQAVIDIKNPVKINDAVQAVIDIKNPVKINDAVQAVIDIKNPVKDKTQEQKISKNKIKPKLFRRLSYVRLAEWTRDNNRTLFRLGQIGVRFLRLMKRDPMISMLIILTVASLILLPNALSEFLPYKFYMYSASILIIALVLIKLGIDFLDKKYIEFIERENRLRSIINKKIDLQAKQLDEIESSSDLQAKRLDEIESSSDLQAKRLDEIESSSDLQAKQLDEIESSSDLQAKQLDEIESSSDLQAKRLDEIESSSDLQAKRLDEIESSSDLQAKQLDEIESSSDLQAKRLDEIESSSDLQAKRLDEIESSSDLQAKQLDEIESSSDLQAKQLDEIESSSDLQAKRLDEIESSSDLQAKQLDEIESSVPRPLMNFQRYQKFNRYLKGEDIEIFQKKWGKILGMELSPRFLLYLAHRIFAIEFSSRGRLATSIEDALLRILVAGSVKGGNLRVLEIGTLYRYRFINDS